MNRKEKSVVTTSDKNSEVLSIIHSNVAGIDIGSKENWVSVSPEICKDNIRQFGSYTEDLINIANWLVECKVTSVVIESTGIYWVPLYEILEKYNIEINLCNANYAKNLPGRKKTDKYDCDWLRKLHSYGMLSSSFIPEKSIREIKTIARYRNKLTQENNRNILRIQKSLTLMNFYLHLVVSDIKGQTGMAIIHAILNGESDPEKLVTLRNKRIKTSKEEMIKALKGNIQFEHLFIMKRAVESYEFICTQIEQCNSAISNLFSHLQKKNNADSEDNKKKL